MEMNQSFPFLKQKENYMYTLLAFFGYIPMIILQIYMSVILFPIAICGYIIWEYRQKSKKIVKKNILFHAFGLICYVITKIISSRHIDLDYQIENVLVMIELILVILFAIFGIALIIEIVKYKSEEEQINGQEKKRFLTISKLEDLKSPKIIIKIGILFIIIGFVQGLTYRQNFMRSSYNEFNSHDGEPYTLSFSGLSMSWMDSTGNDSICEAATYIYNPLIRSIDVYCFQIYEKTIKIVEATPKRLIIIDPWDGKYTHFLEKSIEPEPKDNPDYLVGRTFKDKNGTTYYFKSKTQVEEKYKNKKSTYDYLFVDFNDNYLELKVRWGRYTYDKAKDKIFDLREVK